MTSADTLAALCATAASRWPRKPALIFDATGERLTFEDLDRRSNAFGNALLTLGLQPGDRVAVATANCAAFPVAWLGIGKAGGAIVPLNPAYRAEDARHLLQAAGVKIVVCDAERLPLYRVLADEIGGLILIVTAAAEPGTASFSELVAKAAPLPPPVAVFPESLSNIQFTSGTTGLPKGCMLSHNYMLTAGRAINADIIRLTEDDVMLTAQAFTYFDPQWNLVIALLTGATLVVLDRFHPSTFWQKVCEHGATFFYCLAAMPNLMLAMAPSPQERTHRVRLVMCSAIPAQRHAELEARFKVPWREAYGTTETGADIAVGPEIHAGCVGTGTIGIAMSHREARVVDAGDRPVARGEIGELVVRGIGMMDGYWQNPDATAEAFRNSWYHTGDLARMDARGRVTLAGRKKDMIRRSGENIAAVEVEAVIQQHPAVALAACIAVADTIRGEEVKAFVILKEAHRADPPPPEQLAEFVAAKLARFKVPRYWEYRDDLPRTASERVAKPLLKAEIGTPNEYDREHP